MFERLMAPWGLVRSGVAPDHQATKATADAFARTAAPPELPAVPRRGGRRDDQPRGSRRRYHAVIYAVGAMARPRAGYPGGDPAGQPLRHRVRRLVQRPPRLSPTAPSTSPASGRSSSATATSPSTWPGSCSVTSTRCAVPTSPTTRSSSSPTAASARSSWSGGAGRPRPPSRLLSCWGWQAPASTCRSSPRSWRSTRRRGSGRTATRQSMALYKARLIAELGSAASTDRDGEPALPALADRDHRRRRVESVRLDRNQLVLECGAVVARATDEEEEIACGLLFRSVGYRGAASPACRSRTPAACCRT